MKLAPHPSREMRHTKVLEHWFDVHEAWWSVADDPTWARDRQACYVGFPGITVIVGTQRANPAPLVTSYRVADHSKTTDAAFDAAALARARRKAGPIDREAVRHAARRSSLSARKER